MAADETRPENVRRSRKLTRNERERYLAQPLVAVLSVVSDDERPPSTLPTWYGYRPGGNITVIVRKDKRKSRLIRRAGVLSFSVQHTTVPYRYVTVEGTVVAQRRPSREELVAIGARYIPAADIDGWADWELGDGNPGGQPEYVEIRPDRWLTSDFSDSPAAD